jgi:hypothetical protein
MEATFGGRHKNLHRAIACFEAALCIYTEVDFPDKWAGKNISAKDKLQVRPVWAL